MILITDILVDLDAPLRASPCNLRQWRGHHERQFWRGLSLIESCTTEFCRTMNSTSSSVVLSLPHLSRNSTGGLPGMSPRNGASRKGLRLDGRVSLRENAFDDGLGATVQAAVSPRSARPTDKRSAARRIRVRNRRHLGCSTTSSARQQQRNSAPRLGRFSKASLKGPTMSFCSPARSAILRTAMDANAPGDGRAEPDRTGLNGVRHIGVLTERFDQRKRSIKENPAAAQAQQRFLQP